MNTPTLRWGFRYWIELTLTLGWGLGVNWIHTQTLRFPYKAHVFAALVPIPLKNRIYCLHVSGRAWKDTCWWWPLWFFSMYSLWWDLEDYCCFMEKTEFDFIFLADGEQKWEKGGIQKRWPSPHLPKRPRQRVSWELLAWTFKDITIYLPKYPGKAVLYPDGVFMTLTLIELSSRTQSK